MEVHRDSQSKRPYKANSQESGVTHRFVPIHRRSIALIIRIMASQSVTDIKYSSTRAL